MQIKQKLNSQSLLILGYVQTEELQKIFDVSKEDTFVIDNEYKITEIRNMIRFLNYSPLNSPKKLALIKNAEKLNAESANALLKTLEEPPSYGVIVLATLEERKILPTIASRCQKIRLATDLKFTKPVGYFDPSELGKMSYAERFKWAAEIAESPDLPLVLTLWQQFFQQKLLNGIDVLQVLKKIALAKDLLQTNISVKLLLENLCLEFDCYGQD